MSKFEYAKLADAVAAEIASGALKPGDRLPPQRSFAYERKIATSTASRVYTELLRRGLVVGEVGRGTFISGEARRGIAAATEPRGARIDLEFNYPLLPTQSALIAQSLEGLNRPEALDIALRQATSVGTQAARKVTADYLTRQNRDWSPKPEQMVFTANGRQCIAAALAAVVPTGGRCGVEALTYPFIKGIAARLGVTLVPLAMDEHGVRPDAVQKAHREAHLSALYVQPIIQNPLGMTMPPSRRADLLRVVEKLDLTIIEDMVYGFLDDEPPLAAFAATQQLMADGTASELSRLKRMDAQQRQKIAVACLSGFEIQTNSKSYHLWLTLPSHWRSQTFVAAAARRDIALTPSTTFAVSPGHAPNAIRLALAAPAVEQLDAGLRTLSGMLNAKEEDFDSTE